jgi:hypothetical protein
MKIKKMPFLFLYLLHIALFVSCINKKAASLNKSITSKDSNPSASSKSDGDQILQTSSNTSSHLDLTLAPEGQPIPSSSDSSSNSKAALKGNDTVLTITPGDPLTLGIKNTGEEIIVILKNSTDELAIRRLTAPNSESVIARVNGRPICVSYVGDKLIFSIGGGGFLDKTFGSGIDIPPANTLKTVYIQFNSHPVKSSKQLNYTMVEIKK